MSERTDYARELRQYVIGFFAALSLTLVPFGLVAWGGLSPDLALGVVFGLALLQIMVHFRYFLHIGLRRSTRDDLQLVLFSTLIVALMAGGTLVILFNLRQRMM